MRILVADDNAQWRAIITRILETEHEVIAHVEAGNEVVGVARELRPDAITLDVSMPGLSGMMTLPKLRAELPGARIIIVSVSKSHVYIDEAFNRGADAYVFKNQVLTD